MNLWITAFTRHSDGWVDSYLPHLIYLI